jgi:hypothetical protein
MSNNDNDLVQPADTAKMIQRAIIALADNGEDFSPAMIAANVMTELGCEESMDASELASSSIGMMCGVFAQFIFEPEAFTALLATRGHLISRDIAVAPEPPNVTLDGGEMLGWILDFIKVKKRSPELEELQDLALERFTAKWDKSDTEDFEQLRRWMKPMCSAYMEFFWEPESFYKLVTCLMELGVVHMGSVDHMETMQ